MKWLPYALVGALAWGALSFGAVYPWAYWPLAGVCAGLGLSAILSTRAWQDPRLRRLGFALLAVAVAIGAQLVALPYSMLARLSPGVDQFLREYQLSYHPAALHPLSLTPESTWTALALFAAFSLLLVGLTAAIREMRLDWLMNQMMGFGVALALFAVIQKALLPPVKGLIYGVWGPSAAGNPFGPFVNRNHFAGWMVMTLPLVVGYSCAIFRESRHPEAGTVQGWLRWGMTVEASRFVLVGFAALAMGMSLALSGSRSGLAALAVAMTAFGWQALRSTHGRRARRLVAGYLVVLLIGAVVWAGTDASVERFLHVRTDAPGRLIAWWDTTRIIQDFPLFGVGVGGYQRAMLIYQTAGRPVMYAQAHNEYLQLVAEGGLLVAAPAAAVLVLVIAGIRRRLISGADDPTTFWVRVGAVAGLVGIAAQSLVEFSLQLPGNRVLFVILLAIALHRPARVPSERRPHGRTGR
jgi:hypothetical protein